MASMTNQKCKLNWTAGQYPNKVVIVRKRPERHRELTKENLAIDSTKDIFS
jgi:hypothetical protein